jgi:hypothetical protein
MTLPTFDIAVNRHHVNKLPNGDPRWQDFNDSFENLSLTQVELCQEIKAGHAFTSPHKHERHQLKSGKMTAYRHSVNWCSSQHFGLDHDDIGPDAVLENDFIRQHAAIVYTTASHTADAPRSRSVFIVEQPITDVSKYTEAAAALHWKFAGMADSSCKDAARLFFGSKDCEIYNLGNIMPTAVVEEICCEFRVAMEKDRKNRRPATFPRASTPKLTQVATC